MRPVNISMGVLQADPNGIAESQTPGGAGSLTLDGALATTTISPAQLPRITCAGADVGRTFTFTYLDPDGISRTGTMLGSNGTTSDATFYVTLVTDVSVDAATAGAVEIGYVVATGCASRTVQLNYHQSTFNVGVQARFITGTAPTCSAQFTLDNPNDPDFYTTAIWATEATMSGVSADDTGQITTPSMAARFIQSVGTADGEVEFKLIQGN